MICVSSFVPSSHSRAFEKDAFCFFSRIRLVRSLFHSIQSFPTGWTGINDITVVGPLPHRFINALVHVICHAPCFAASVCFSSSAMPNSEGFFVFAAGPRCLSFLLGNAFSKALTQSLVSVHAVKISTT